MRSSSPVLSTILLLVTLSIPQSNFAQPKYIEITANRVNIRVGPGTSFPVVGKTQRGDIFELHGTEGRWYRIRMFSVNWRYVHKSLAKLTPHAVSLPNRTSVRRAVFRALVDAEDRAEAKADRKYPLEDKHGRPIAGNLRKNIDYMWLLGDRYKLEVMHRFRVQPPIHDTIISEGVKKNW